jgi:phospholipid-binding lipoprotein MlaA
VDTRARLLDVEGALAGAYDPYAFIRSAYLQRRAFKVHGGQVTGEEDQEQRLLEQAGEDQPSPPSPAPAQSPPAQSPSPH